MLLFCTATLALAAIRHGNLMITMHVGDTGQPGDEFIRPRDVHILATDPGELPASSSGTVAVTVVNGTVKSYQLSLGPLVTPGSGLSPYRNITAPMTTASGKSHTYVGKALLRRERGAPL